MNVGEKALEALWALVESGDSRFMISDLRRRFGDAANLLLSAGFLGAADNPQVLICRICHEPHKAKLQFCAHTKRWRYACLNGGEWIDADGEAVVAVRFTPRVLSGGVAAALSINKRPQERVKGVLWALGTAKSERIAWTAMVAHCVKPARFEAVVAELPLVSKLAGLVLTTTSVSRYLSAIAGHRFSPLSHHLRMDDDGGLVIDPNTIVAALGRAPASKRSHGRPTPRDEIYAIALTLTDEEAARGENALLPIFRAKLSADAPPLKDKAFLGHIDAGLKKRPKNTKT